MTTKGRKYFSGNTLDNALMQAARHHGLPPEEVAYRKLEKRHGFLRARKGVVIEVDPEAPRRAPEDAADATPEPTPEPKPEVAAEPRVVESPALPEAEPEEIEPVMVEESQPEPTDEDPAAEEIELVMVEESQPEPTDEDPAAEEVEPETQVEEPAVEEPESEPQDEEPSTDRALRDEEDLDELMDGARRGLQDILEFASLNLESEVTAGDGQLEIELWGPDRDRLLEDRGNLLLAIQHLLPRLIRGFTGRSIPCHVDSENFHETREEELRELAEEAASEVRRNQRPRTLPPMNPAERRIIHVTLADKKEVHTESQGRGFFKRVTISPAMRRPRGFDRYSR